MNHTPPTPPSGELAPPVVLCEICGDAIKGLFIGGRRGGFAADCCLECGAELGEMCAEGIGFATHPRDYLIKMARARMASKRSSWRETVEALLDERQQLWEALAAI